MSIQKIIQTSTVIIIWLVLIIPLYGQDETGTLATEIELITVKKGDGSRVFNCTLIDENGEPAKSCMIHYYMAGDSAISLGSIETDENGKAVLSIPETHEWIKDTGAFITVSSEFKGNEQYDPSTIEITFKDAMLKLEFLEEDSVKMVYVSGVILYPNDEERPIADQDVYLYVPRMFSQLKIGDGWLEVDGRGGLEFPLKVIGDTIGNIEVIAKIEEHDELGNIETSAMINWATPRWQHPREVPERELWTPIAPLWMIITLIIMLSGVWGHYIYAVFQLIKIRKIGKKEDLTKEA
ncbi:hypothetical protein ACFL6I_18965 [candidate division KSB1 bacterium]